MSERPTIVCVGHVLLDCFAAMGNGRFDVLAKQFSTGGAVSHVSPDIMKILYSELDRFPAEPPSSFIREAGGSATNTAMAASQLGMEAHLWGSIGDDEAGRTVTSMVDKAGVAFHAVASAAPTGIFCRIMSDEGRSRTIVSPGAAFDIRGTEIPEKNMPERGILYIDGLLIDAMEWLVRMADRAHRQQSIVAMDISTPGNARANASGLLDFAGACCDFVFANQEEFDVLFPVDLQPRSGKTCWVVKQGSAGARCITGTVFTERAADKMWINNPVGAGDFFSAGFLHSAIKGLPPGECLEEGNKAAAARLRTQN
ncbi:MAG: carbohydrate kinase family protein [Spirochaetaceae bacterium]|nr:carbohydrate kinase family protein [Spirochaetaceae bacterium]